MVRSHIGSDTSNPEATPQIPPSCWTSCSLHNRIRMNRPRPPFLLPLLLPLAFLFTLLPLRAPILPLSPPLLPFAPLLPFFLRHSSLLLSPRLSSPFSTLRFSFYSFLCALLISVGITDAPRFFRKKSSPTHEIFALPSFEAVLLLPFSPLRITVSPPFIESCWRFSLPPILYLSLSPSLVPRPDALNIFLQSTYIKFLRFFELYLSRFAFFPLPSLSFSLSLRVFFCPSRAATARATRGIIPCIFRIRDL